MVESTNLTLFDPASGIFTGNPVVERRLSQLNGLFADMAAYDELAATGTNPLIYTVSSIAPANGSGQLHYGLGRIMPGKIGQEYFMTRGHYHEWRMAAEVYIGLSGSGYMLLEAEEDENEQLIPLQPNSVVYVPGYTAHRTINTGTEPLTYLGVYPADAGHDYASLAESNFRNVVIDVDGEPTLVPRDVYLAQLRTKAAKSKK